VKCYYVLEHDGKHTPSQLDSPPQGLAGMVFNLSNPFKIVENNTKSAWVPQHFLAGQFKKNYTLCLEDNTHIIGIAFWPAGLSHLLGIPMIEFAGQRTELSLVMGDEVRLIEEQLLGCTTNFQCIQVMEHFLTNKLSTISLDTDWVDCAIQRILDQKGILSIRQLSDDLCISPRQFRRRFTEKVGISPKLFSRIKRFIYISHLSSESLSSWMEMVGEGGYYDQSHFIRDFSDFSGRNPSEFVHYHRSLAQLMG